MEHYHYFDSRMHGRRSCIQHPKEDFLVIMADLRLGNGKLLVAWEADKIVDVYKRQENMFLEQYVEGESQYS